MNAPAAPDSLSLHALFSDHAVLQRGEPIPVRGTARPGAGVRVRFAGETHDTTADEAGRWETTLAARDAGNALELTVTSGATTITRRDICFGEVWVGSGQSNMDWPLAQSHDALAEMHGARFPELRLFRVPSRPSLVPEQDIDASWTPCTPETVRMFSAVLYHFARRLLPELPCPIGLVHTAWGGTEALPWTPRAALADHPEFDPPLQRVDAVRELAPPPASVQHPDTGNEGEAKGWAHPEFDDVDWPTLELPCYWQPHGLAFNGAVWFRLAVDIPPSWAGHELSLELGVVDDFDTTYFNGVRVGGIGPENPNAWNTRRHHIVPGALVRAGHAVIAVRVFDWMGEGGVVGPAAFMRLSLCSNPRETLPLSGDWRYAIERAIPLPTAGGKAEGHTVPTALYNGMVHPLTRFPVRGVLWYQGESDVARAAWYPAILRALITGWRAAWGRPDLPFFLVQLAPFQSAGAFAEDEWAELREAQARVAAEVPGTDYVATLDCGNPYDIHPGDKRTVGARLAALALSRVYGAELPWSGPRFQKLLPESGFIRIQFTHYQPGLRTRDGGPVRGFDVAGEDRVFRPATATIEGTTVLVHHPDVPVPTAVRYAWAACPVANLENADGLPAAPFRSDDWPRVTEGRR